MWQQVYDPFGSPILSALVAAVPIIIFLLGLTFFKLSGLKATTLTLVLALAEALFLWGMPLGAGAGAILLGVLSGLWPIGWIVLMAVWLYRITVRAGNFDIVRSSISSISADQRIQVLLIAFCLGGFLEGAAGFGTPIAICGALMVTLGFNAIKASMLCLIANGVYAVYGAVAIPVIVGAKQASLDQQELTTMIVLILQAFVVFCPLILVAILDGLRGIKETGLVALGLGIITSAVQAPLVIFGSPEIGDIVPPLIALVVFAAVMKKWQPKNIYREPGAPSLEEVQGQTQVNSGANIAKAWSPFIVLSGMILLWSIPAVKNLWAADGPLSWTTLSLNIPGLHQQISKGQPLVSEPTALPATFSWAILGATGTAILIAVFITIATTKITLSQSIEELGLTFKQLWSPILMICLVMAVANVMNFSGMITAIALAVASAGALFPLLAPIIGWIGVFVTGSVTNNNTLFAALQATTAQQIGVNPTLLVAANTTGGSIAKIVSPQSIAVAAAGVGQAGKESEITSAAIKYSLILLAVMCLWVYLLSLFI